MSLDQYRIMSAFVALPQFTLSDIERYAEANAHNIQKFFERHIDWFAEAGTRARTGAGRPERLRRLTDLGMQQVEAELSDLSSLANSLGKPAEPDIVQLIDSKLKALESDDVDTDDRDFVIEELNDDMRAADIIVRDLGKRFGEDAVAAFGQTLAAASDRLTEIQQPKIEKPPRVAVQVATPVASHAMAAHHASAEPGWFKVMAQSRHDILDKYLNEWHAKLDVFVDEFGEWLQRVPLCRGLVFLIDSIDKRDDLTPEVKRLFSEEPVDAACFRLARFTGQDRLDFFTRLRELTDDPRAQRAQARVVITSTPKDRRWQNPYCTVAEHKRDRWERQMRGLTRNIAACNATLEMDFIVKTVKHDATRHMHAAKYSWESETLSDTGLVRALMDEQTSDTALCLERIRTAPKARFKRDLETDMVRIRIDQPVEDLRLLIPRFVASMQK